MSDVTHSLVSLAPGQRLKKSRKDVWIQYSPTRGDPRIQKEGENEWRRLVHPSPKRANHVNFRIRLVSQEGEGRELLGEWMKMTSVRSQDQRRMLQANSHTLPTNEWIHKITKGKESDRCDLCKTLWIAGEGRFTTEKDLPEQNMGRLIHGIGCG